MKTLASLLFSCLVLGGCGRVREVGNCRELARRVNPTFDEIEARLEKEQGARAYRDASVKYRKLSRELASTPVGIGRVEKPVQDLATSLGEAAKVTARMADAIEKGDAAGKHAAYRDLGTNARLHRAIVSRIDDICRGH